MNRVLVRKKTTSNSNQSLFFLNNVNVNFLIRILAYFPLIFAKRAKGMIHKLQELQ